MNPWSQLTLTDRGSTTSLRWSRTARRDSVVMTTIVALCDPPVEHSLVRHEEMARAGRPAHWVMWSGEPAVH